MNTTLAQEIFRSWGAKIAREKIVPYEQLSFIKETRNKMFLWSNNWRKCIVTKAFTQLFKCDVIASSLNIVTTQCKCIQNILLIPKDGRTVQQTDRYVQTNKQPASFKWHKNCQGYSFAFSYINDTTPFTLTWKVKVILHCVQLP